ncbi:GAF domain-containing sensor histidine kinase [Manganibacter manganicus]|uniref:ATPase n=1 Tax=Manganibacter manganicus TaxID=1873176 RepID=A0A1V8RLY1_9HYPH|nr:GAF domain-containing protein [Pseudaminobacter manganicus]OQM74215.1 ATPase [Pseudaminobacter manganicus]
MAKMATTLVERLLAISHALSGHIDPGEAFRATAIEIGTIIPHDHMDVAILLHDGQQHVCYEAGVHTSWGALAKAPLSINVSPVRSVLRGEAAYLLTADALEDPRFHFDGAIDEPIYSAGLRSRIIVPLKARGEIVGALNISRHTPDCYSADDVEAAQHCADFVAPYIYALIQSEQARRAMLAENEARNRKELLRVGAARLTEGMECERRRIAMDLHDQTLADLSRIVRQISALHHQGVARAAQLADLEREIVNCLTELRHIVDDMRPGVLELFGLRDAIEAHLNRSVSRATPPIAVHIKDQSEGAADMLPERIRTALYRIVQEAINNAVRHAAPKRIDVSLLATGPTLTISITDDGVGYQATEAEEGGGIGHMHTRAALIGADLKVEPGKERGTRVCVEAALEGAAAPILLEADVME